MNRYRTYGPTDDPPDMMGDVAFVGVNEYEAIENIPPGQVQAAVNMDFLTLNAGTRGGFVCIPELAFNATPFAAWVTRTEAVANDWRAVTYGGGLFVAVSETGVGNRVMTSPDGVTWTSRTSAADNTWSTVTYGNGLFVAVAEGVTANGVMTSPDGVTWTGRTSADTLFWTSVTYGNGTYVAVASDAVATSVMTSTDGITWTLRTGSSAGGAWYGVAYGNGLFVAVGGGGTRVMTSPDGIIWTSRTATALNWRAVTYANGQFVAVGVTGTTRAMTSSDGITWTAFTTPTNYGGNSIAYGSLGFMGARVTLTTSIMVSPDGEVWNGMTSPNANAYYYGVAYGNNTYVMVAGAASTGARVATLASNSVFASGIYSDPDDAGSQWIMLLGAATVGFYSFNKQSRSVSLGSYRVDAQSTIVQCNNQVYIFRGDDDTPLYWTGGWSTQFTIAPTPAQAAGFEIIPNSNQATFYQNRLWVKNGKDTVSASDILDFTTFDQFANDFNLNTGSSDYLVTTFPFGENALVVFKNKSILVLQNVQGSLEDVTVTEVTRQVGCVGINAVVSVGPDLAYMSDSNINLLSLTATNNSIQHKTLPLSRNIIDILKRVNWNYAYKVSMAYWNNKLYVALPLDGATVCNSVVVYNFLNDNWFGEWSFASSIDMRIQGWAVATFNGLQRLHAILEDGRIMVTDEGQNDISGTTVAEISTSMTTRAYRANNENHFQRRLFLDLATNRPSFSVVAYTDGASESTSLLSAQTFSRTDSWLFNDSTYTATNANDDYNRAYRKDYSTGPDSIQPGTGFQPEMLQEIRLPLLTRRQGRLSWLKVTNTTGVIDIRSSGFESRPGTRGSLVQV